MNATMRQETEAIEKIIVIGGSAGAFEVLKTIIKDIPANFHIPVCVVWHMSADVRGFLATVLNSLSAVPVSNAVDGEIISGNHIYIAPPDHHLVIEGDHLRVTHGPKENRFRPAIDPLFRSAAFYYGSRVIGIILSGALDDGTAGLWQIKNNGGTVIVQDPDDADVPSMPASALREVQADFQLPAAGIAQTLITLSRQPATAYTTLMKDERTKKEINIAKGISPFDNGSVQLGDLSPFTCPDCHGVLSRIREGSLSRYRCHTGHAFSADTLLHAITTEIEDSLYNAMRATDEFALLLNQLGDEYSAQNEPTIAARCFQQGIEAKKRSEAMRLLAASQP